MNFDDGCRVVVGSDLSAYLDGELPRERRVEVASHLSLCARCRNTLEVWAEAAARLRGEDDGRDPAPRIREGLAPLVRARRSRPVARWMAAVAAVVLIAAPMLFFSKVLADRDCRALVRLESDNASATGELRSELEGLRLEVGAMRVRLESPGVPEGLRDRLDRGLSELTARAAALESRLAAIQDDLDRRGLMSAVEAMEREGGETKSQQPEPGR